MQVRQAKIAIFRQYLAPSRAVNDLTACQVQYIPAAPDPGKLMLVAGKRRRLFLTGDDDEVFMTRSLNVTRKTIQQHLIVLSGKSEADVTNNKRLRSRYCTVEANY